MPRRPKYITKGDTIGITAPSYGAFIEPYCLMLPISEENLRERGYNIVEGKTARLGDGIGISTDPKVCAKELVEFYKREDIDAIISAGGGELMCETISHVDFWELKNCTPKWFMGYSDNTNFIFPLVTIADTQAIYGPCISGFSKIWEETEKYAFDLLEGKRDKFFGLNRFVDPEKEEPLWNEGEEKVYTEDIIKAPYALNADRELVVYENNGSGYIRTSGNEIRMKGMLLGGCLDILVNICGSRFDNVRNFKKEHGDIIWVLEACDLSPMDIRRSIWCLKEAGWLEGAAGFIFGRPREAWRQEMLGADQYNAVTGVLSEFDVPIVLDAEIGHIDPMLPVVMGAEAEVRILGNDLNLTYT